MLPPDAIRPGGPPALGGTPSSALRFDASSRRTSASTARARACPGPRSGVWRQLSREGLDVARCSVERLMRAMGLRGAVRGKTVRTTLQNPAAPCPLDRVNRELHAPSPNRLWVSDFTPAFAGAGSTWRPGRASPTSPSSSMPYARRIVGWRVGRSATAGFVLDALEQAIHQRRPPKGAGLIAHFRQGQPTPRHPVHRASRRGRDRAVRGLGRRQLRQRAG